MVPPWYRKPKDEPDRNPLSTVLASLGFKTSTGLSYIEEGDWVLIGNYGFRVTGLNEEQGLLFSDTLGVQREPVHVDWDQTVYVSKSDSMESSWLESCAKLIDGEFSVIGRNPEFLGEVPMLAFDDETDQFWLLRGIDFILHMSTRGRFSFRLDGKILTANRLYAVD